MACQWFGGVNWNWVLIEIARGINFLDATSLHESVAAFMQDSKTGHHIKSVYQAYEV